MLRIAHIAVAVWGVWISVWCVILNAGNVDMNFVYCKYIFLLSISSLFLFSSPLADFCGTIIGAPVVPVMLTVLWSKLNKSAVLIGSMGGTALAILAWIITCRYFYGTVNVANLISSYSSLAGNTVSLCTGGIIAVIISLMKPDNYDFTGTRNSTFSASLLA